MTRVDNNGKKKMLSYKTLKLKLKKKEDKIKAYKAILSDREDTIKALSDRLKANNNATNHGTHQSLTVPNQYSPNLPNAASFPEKLKERVQNNWPTRHQSRYTKVNVMLVEWELGDVKIRREHRELKKVFEEAFGFRVYRYVLPDYDAEAEKYICEKVGRILDGSRDTLNIFLYTGHGEIVGKGQYPTLKWVATNMSNSACMDSKAVQELFEQDNSDCIMIYDACESTITSHSVKTRATNSSRRGVMELLAASGFDNQASGTGPWSFSRALIKALLSVSNAGVATSVPDLFADIVKLMRKDFCNTSHKYEPGTPVHVTLKSEASARQIFLHPLSVTSVPLPAPQTSELQTLMVSLKMDQTKKPGKRMAEWLLAAPKEVKGLELQ